MTNRPQRASQYQYQPPSIERPNRAAKTVATGRLVDRSSSPLAGSPRRDSHLTTKGKRRRVICEESSEESSGQGGGQSSNYGSEGERDGSGLTMDIDKPKGQPASKVEEDVQMLEEEPESASEVKACTGTTNRKLTNAIGKKCQGMLKEAPVRASTEPVESAEENVLLYIEDNGPEMKIGDHPRFYAKVIRRKGIEQKNAAGWKIPIPEEEDVRLPDHQPMLLPHVDLSILQCDFCTHKFSEIELVRFAMSARVLPLLKMWACMWLNPDEKSQDFYKEMRKAFPSAQKPWNVQVDLIADFAAQKAEFTMESAEVVYGPARLAWRLVNANSTVNDFDFFLKFGGDDWAHNEPYKFATRLLLAVWDDVETKAKGFFRTLFRQECQLSQGLRPEVRQLYECWYIVDERMYQKQPIRSTRQTDYHNHNNSKVAGRNIPVMESVDQQAFQQRRRALVDAELEEGEIREDMEVDEVQANQPLSDLQAIEALNALQPLAHAKCARSQRT